MEQKRDKKMQFRLTEEEQKLITDTLKGENISELIRIYLLVRRTLEIIDFRKAETFVRTL